MNQSHVSALTFFSVLQLFWLGGRYLKDSCLANACQEFAGHSGIPLTTVRAANATAAACGRSLAWRKESRSGAVPLEIGFWSWSWTMLWPGMPVAFPRH